jgi:DNA-binding LacI/PurR family transcriptional regulator
MARKKVVGIEDVARAAGVSITTVSRVINKFPTVKEENRRKVEEVIRRLNFKPNVAAQRLASGSNYTIGLEIPRYEGIFHSFYAMEIFRSVGIACDALHVDFLLHLTDGKTSLNTAAVGGVVFADIINNRRHVEDLLQGATPVVLMNYLAKDIEVSSVSVDNAGGAEAATEYLIHLGHTKIAFVTGDLLTQAAADRLAGYKKAMEKGNLACGEDLVLRADYSRKSARAAAERILKGTPAATAVFASSDDMAVEMVSTFNEGGWKVPEDISVVGFDDDPVCLYGSVALSTVRQPIREMAERAVKELYLRMQDPDRQMNRIVLPTELVIRDSSAAPKKT